MMRFSIFFGVLSSVVTGFVPAHVAVSPVSQKMTIRHGFLDNLMDKLDGGADKDDKWKEDMYQAQQEILKRRRKTGGFIDEDMEKEIRARRESYAQEENELKKVQQSGKNDILDDWKKARDAGKFKTASKGLQRDKQSSRFGSAGLFAERVDERLPYIDRGYVADKKDKDKTPPADNDFFGNLKKMLGQ